MKKTNNSGSSENTKHVLFLMSEVWTTVMFLAVDLMLNCHLYNITNLHQISLNIDVIKL